MHVLNTRQKDIIAALQREILPLQGYKASLHACNSISLGPINEAFPCGIFPLGAVHEFISSSTEDSASTYGFVMAIVAKIAQNAGVTLWLSSSRLVFPPALVIFGISPENVIFLDLEKELDLLWATEEALKCEGLSAIVCETPNLSFTASRRFQLAVEQSGITGFILRQNAKSLSTTTSIARWKISSLNSQPKLNVPGIGFPRWKVELLKIRNGKPGGWQVEFSNKEFRAIANEIIVPDVIQQRKAG